MKRLALSAMWMIAIAPITGLAHAEEVAAAGSSTLAEEGRRIYAGQCSRCHGYHMINEGLVGFDLGKFPKDDHERFVNSVSRGKQPKMPPWGDVLSANDIEALWLMCKRAAAMSSSFLLAALATLTLAASQASAAEPLRICLDDSAPPFSFNNDGKARGFDLALVQAIAGKLDRSLSVQWFSTEDQPEAGKETKTSVAALLADDRCDLAGAYPLLADALGGELADVGHLPRYKGGSREDRRRSIPLNPLMATAPFIYTAPTVVLGPTASVTTIHTLADLDGVRIGVEQSSVADIILLLYEHNRLLPRLHHIPPGRGLLERLDSGEYDAVLVDIHRFDGYRVTHPATALKLTGYLHPLGFNLGFVGLAREADLIHAVDAMIGQWLQDGTIERLAANAGLTYLPPRDPPVRPSLSLADLAKE